MTHCIIKTPVILSCDLALNLNCNLNWQAPKEEGKKKKKGGGKTVSSVYLLSLMELMAQVSEWAEQVGTWLKTGRVFFIQTRKSCRTKDILRKGALPSTSLRKRSTF